MKWTEGLSDDDACSALVAARQDAMQTYMRRTPAAIGDAAYDGFRVVSLCNLAAALEANE